MTLLIIAIGGALLLCSFFTTVLPIMSEGGSFKEAFHTMDARGPFWCYAFLGTPIIGIGMIIIGFIRYKIGW